MNKEEIDLALYREHLDAVYGNFGSAVLGGRTTNLVRGSAIIETFSKDAFDKGFREFMIHERNEYEPRN